MDSHRERLLRLAATAGDERGLSRQSDLVKATGLSRSTIHRFKQGDSVSEAALRKISRAVGWTADSAEAVLKGGEPTRVTEPSSDAADLERRYRHTETVVEGGRVLKIVEDALLKIYMAGGTDQTFEDFDRTRRRLVEVLEEEGIQVAERNSEASPETAENT